MAPAAAGQRRPRSNRGADDSSDVAFNISLHARRGLKEVFDSNGSPSAKDGLKQIAQLYKIEDKIRGEAPATRQFVRWAESAPLVNASGVWFDEQRSRLCEKLTHIANQWDGLLLFLYDGRVEMDSNFVENRIRPLKLTAKLAQEHAILSPGSTNSCPGTSTRRQAEIQGGALAPPPRKRQGGAHRPCSHACRRPVPSASYHQAHP